MQWSFIKIFRVRNLNHLAEVHNGNTMANVPHHGEIVRNKQISEVVLLLEVL
tara:strand:- start:29 stop:184 length:156 start_codon:yes stop_codon:yes gene_type:complete